MLYKCRPCLCRPQARVQHGEQPMSEGQWSTSAKVLSSGIIITKTILMSTCYGERPASCRDIQGSKEGICQISRHPISMKYQWKHASADYKPSSLGRKSLRAQKRARVSGLSSWHPATRTSPVCLLEACVALLAAAAKQCVVSVCCCTASALC